MNLCAFTSVCKEDLWLSKQYTEEAERLELPYCIHLDRLRTNQARTLLKHPLCRGFTQSLKDREFTEQHKQAVFDLAVGKGYEWLMAWDIDETFSKDTYDKLKMFSSGRPVAADYARVQWVNLWGDDDHIRVDGPFTTSRRVKFYRVGSSPKRYKWFFDHPITNGAKAFYPGTTIKVDVVMIETDIVCLHHGLKTDELRRLHKERWDRIYSTAVGENPYGIWRYALDPRYSPIIIEHGYNK